MKPAQNLNRREFLHTSTGMAGLFTAAHLLHAPAAGAQTPKPAGSPALAKLLAQLEAKGRRMLSVPREDGQFLNLLVKVSRAKSVLEVGTSQGYASIWIGLGLEETGGKLTTIDIDPEKVRLAKANLQEAGLAHRVTCLEGDAHQVVPTLAGPFDFVFLDADKDGQSDYFTKLYPNKLLPGGLIAVHNAIQSKEPMQEYLQMIRQHPDFDSVTLSLTMHDGFSVSYRKRT